MSLTKKGENIKFLFQQKRDNDHYVLHLDKYLR